METRLEPLPDMPLLPITSEETIASCRALPVTNNDIFVCSYPKSGTTWTQNLVCRSLAAKIGMVLPDDWHLSQSAPFYEVNQYWKNHEEDPSRRRVAAKRPLEVDNVTFRVFNTHLRPHQLPPNAKCIYVMRDPLDVLTSLYYHLANMDEADGGYTGTPQALCAEFQTGTVVYGKWQDHMEAWLGGKNNDGSGSEILLLHYEDMKTNLDEEATKLARFLGVQEEALARVVDNAVPHCTFAAMRTERWRYTPVTVQWKKNKSTGKPYDDFVRAGRIGDGASFLDSYFTDELEKQWKKDMVIARNRWCQAGVDPSIIVRYLKE